MESWFNDRLEQKIIVRTMRDDYVREVVVKAVRKDCVFLKNSLSVCEWFPFTSLDFFRDAL